MYKISFKRIENYIEYAYGKEMVEIVHFDLGFVGFGLMDIKRGNIQKNQKTAQLQGDNFHLLASYLMTYISTIT